MMKTAYLNTPVNSVGPMLVATSQVPFLGVIMFLMLNRKK